jgi:hypothetical protein
MKKRPQVSRTRFLMPKLQVQNIAVCISTTLDVTNSPCQFEHFEIWFVKIKWRSDRRSREHVSTSTSQWHQGFASRLRSKWQTVRVSSSVVENTFSNTKTHRQIIAVCISRPAVAISFRLSSEFHCARCDILRTERRPLLSMWHATLSVRASLLSVRESLLSVRALRNLIC